MMVEVKSISGVQIRHLLRKKNHLSGASIDWTFCVQGGLYEGEHLLSYLRKKSATSFVSLFGAIHLWLCCGCRSSPEIVCQSNCVGGSMSALFTDLKV